MPTPPYDTDNSDDNQRILNSGNASFVLEETENATHFTANCLHYAL